MFAESSASDLFRKFMGNESNCSTNQMARKPMNVNKNKLLNHEKMCIKSDVEEILFKLAKNDSDKAFLLTSNFWP